MFRIEFYGLLLCGLLIAGSLTAQKSYPLNSPDGHLRLTVTVGSQLQYSLRYDDELIVAPSAIALQLDKAGTLGPNGRVSKQRTSSVNLASRPVVAQKSAVIKENYNQLTLEFRNDFRIVFRAYNEGIAYRFETSLKEDQRVLNETFEISLPTNDTIFYPEEEGFYSHNERVYQHYAVRDITNEQLASLPALIASSTGIKMVVSESDLQDYAGLWLRGTGGQKLVGVHPAYPTGEKGEGDRDVRVTKRADYLAQVTGARTYPWRYLAVAKNDHDLITNELTYLLADPPQGDFSWIRPGQVAWDWWNDNNIYGVDFRAGVNTETYKYYVDFAAKNSIDYIILDEGWSDTRNLLKAKPDIDLPELFAYAKSKNVGIIPWVLWNTLDSQLIPALDYFEQLGAVGIKIDFMQRDDQPVVNYYWRVAEEAAKRRLLVDYHGAYKPAGLHRTWPNVITREGVRGLEWSKWDQGATISPEHNVTLPYIRMVAGPMDYTPGAMINAQRGSWFPVHTTPMSLGTRCHQLAMFVVYESPLQMLADSPTHYEREPENLAFLSAVPTVWDTTIALAGKVGDYIAVARRAANGDWYLGAMTDWTPRELTLDLSFLGEGTYTLELFRDGINADRNANDYKREERTVRATDKLTVKLAPGGGMAGLIKK